MLKIKRGGRDNIIQIENMVHLLDIAETNLSSNTKVADPTCAMS